MLYTQAATVGAFAHQLFIKPNLHKSFAVATTMIHTGNETPLRKHQERKISYSLQQRHEALCLPSALSLFDENYHSH